MSAPASPWLTADQAAVYAQVSAKSIYRACASGRLRHARLEGRRDIRLMAQWIDEWLLATAQPVEVRGG